MAQFVGFSLFCCLVAALSWNSGTLGDPIISLECKAIKFYTYPVPWRFPPPNVGLLYTIRDQYHTRTNSPWLIVERDSDNTSDTDAIASNWRYNGQQCNYQFRVCGPARKTDQDNWLVSPYVYLRDAKLINVSVSYTMKNCDPSLTLSCSVRFKIYTLQTSYPNISKSMVNEVTFKSVGPYTADPLDGLTLNYLHFPLVVMAEGLFVAFRDEGACMTMVEMNVTYSICPPLVEQSIILPSTLGQTGPVDVMGKCVNNSMLKGELPKRVCEPEGYWSRWLGGDCLCDKGYGAVNTANNSLCKMCEPGEFKNDIGNSHCLPCPLYSNSSVTGAFICNCAFGWYRTATDPPESNCTGLAGSPTNVSIVSLNSRNVSLAWIKPMEDGGRSDLEFILDVYPPLQKSTHMPLNVSTIANNVSSIVVGLIPHTNYTLRVGSQNGVNKMLSQPDYSAPVNFTTLEDAPDDPPQNFSVVTSGNSLVLKWSPPQKPNGIVKKYTVQYFWNETGMPTDKQTETVDAPHTSTDVPKKFQDFFFQIRAHTSIGPGPFSSPVKPEVVEEEEPNGSEMNLLIIIGSVAGAVTLGIIIVVIIAFLLYCRQRRATQGDYSIAYSNNTASNNGTSATVQATLSGKKKFYVDPSNYECLDTAMSEFATEIPPSHIQLHKAIGEGEFGEVFVGKHFSQGEKTNRKVAVKTLKSGASKKSRTDFLVEASIMGQFSHPNVISLVGVVTRADPVMIVIEFMDNGSLDNFLKDHDNRLSVEQQLHMALDVAHGMDYLSDMRFIHRDLATRNVLVSSEWRCKVADFGLSREALDENAYDVKTGGKIPVRWTAPEAITYRKFTQMSDVWSFGVLLWEIMAYGEHPYYDWPNSKVLDSVRRGYRLPPPMNCPEDVHELMQKCWKEERIERPPFSELCELIEVLLARQLTHSIAYGVPSDIEEPNNNNATYSSVQGWLQSIKMERYVKQFEDSGYNDLGLCWQLNDRDLAERVGVSVKGHRHKILKSIREVNTSLSRQTSRKI